MSELTQAEVLRLFHYDPETGVFTNRVARGHVKAGDIAGNKFIRKNRKTGYVIIRLNNVNYYAHRLVWMYVYGRWPQHEIDHKDGDGLNNALMNLRDATASENKQNVSAAWKTNKYTGIKGVAFRPLIQGQRKYLAHLSVNCTCVLFKCFATLEEAKAARREAELKYHPFAKK